MARALYSLLLWLGLPVVMARLWRRGRREPGYTKHVGERFGRYGAQAPGPVLWVHAVSVGEVRASVPLVASLRSAYPDHSILLTCMTAAGRDAINQVFGQSVIAAYLPYDYAFAVRRFLGHFRPRVGVLIETELWVNLLAECRRRSIPVMLASGRMSQKSARGYRRLSGLMRPAFEGLAAVCAQSEDDASRIAALGAHHVSVAGNLKFDFVPDAGLLSAGRALKAAWVPRKAILLASTREGEEAPLLEAFLARRSGAPLMIVVPRHPQRFEPVAALVAAAGMTCVRRSGREPIGPAEVLLGDTMGEMATYYSAADVAIIGGSLLPYGGQNLIEACAIGVPVVIGPHVHNFSEAVRLAVEAGAAVKVADAGEAIDVALALLADPEKCAAMGAAGLAFCAAHRGATEKHLAAIRGLLRP